MKPLAPLHRALLAAIALAMPFSLPAQQSAYLFDTPVDAAGSANPPSTTPVQSPAKAPNPLTARWLDLTTFTHSQRYRNDFSDTGYHVFENGQERSVLAGKFKLDAAGKYDIGFRASTGRSFNWAYSDYAGEGFTARLDDGAYQTALGAGINAASIAQAAAADPVGYNFVNNVHSTGWQFFVRELYFSASPISALTVEFGSFGIENGLSSEITTFDGDGFIAGERVRVNNPAHLFVDEVGFTNAYFGYIDTPNFFARGNSLKKSNYRQIYAKKQVNPRIGLSGDFTWLNGTQTLHEALVSDVKEIKLFDNVRLEGYERINVNWFQGDHENPRQGVAIIGEKKIGKHLSGDFGFASIDRDYGLYNGHSFEQESGFSLNGDNYNTGIRVFSHLSCKINPVITAFGFYTHITGTNIANLNTQGLHVGMTFDLKALVNSEKLVF